MLPTALAERDHLSKVSIFPDSIVLFRDQWTLHEDFWLENLLAIFDGLCCLPTWLLLS